MKKTRLKLLAEKTEEISAAHPELDVVLIINILTDGVLIGLESMEVDIDSFSDVSEGRCLSSGSKKEVG